MMILIPTLVLVAVTIGIAYFFNAIKGKQGHNKNEDKVVVEEKNLYRNTEKIDNNR